MHKAFSENCWLAPFLSVMEAFFFNDKELSGMATGLADEYASAQPFKHVVIDSFLPDNVASRIAQDFPKPDVFPKPVSADAKYQPHKLGGLQRVNFRGVSPYIRHILLEFNSLAFLDFLETLTGIKGLIPDPHFDGGGLHQILPGGKLAVHADFNVDRRRGLYRRINVLIYFNRDWKTTYGSALELWKPDMSGPDKLVFPVYNRCVIFNTTVDSYHGHPDPLACPQGVTRNSMAFYYYTHDWPAGVPNPYTAWRQRPGEAAPKETNLAVMVKNFMREITPPVLYRAAKLVARRRA